MKNNRKIAREGAELQRLTREFWSQRSSLSPREPSDALRPVGDAQSADAPNGSAGRRRSLQTLDLVGVNEIVALSGFTKGSVYVFAGRSDFPAPAARLNRRLLWNRDDIERWLEAKQRRKGD